MLKRIFEFFIIIIISLAIVLPVRFFLVQPFFVKGSSMEPNFANGEYLIINELIYRIDSPQRGEVVVFKYPSDPRQYYIKRIIGLSGETIEIRDGYLKIYNQAKPEGFILDESKYLSPSEKTPGEYKITLKDDEYFVLGDNRIASFDSRRWGPLPKEYIIGRAWLRAWPIAKAAVLSFD